MLDYLLEMAQTFTREHGTPPAVIRINPLHYGRLARSNPELFAPEPRPRLGFRLVIVPARELAHPQACLHGPGSSRYPDGVMARPEGGRQMLREAGAAGDGIPGPPAGAHLAGATHGASIFTRCRGTIRIFRKTRR